MRLLFFLVLFVFPNIFRAQSPDTTLVFSKMDSLLRVMEGWREKSQFKKMAESGKIADSLAASLPATASPERLIKTHVLYAEALFGLGSFSAAEAQYREALRGRERANGPQHRHCGVLLTRMGVAVANQIQFARADSLYRQAEPILAFAPGPNSLEYAVLLSNKAKNFTNMGRYEEAVSLFQAAKKIMVALGEQGTDYLLLLLGEGVNNRNGFRFEAAEKSYMEALAVIERFFPEKEKRRYGKCLFYLGSLYLNMQRFEKAESFFLRAKNIQQETPGKKSRDYGETLLRLGIMYRESGRKTKAETYLKEAHLVLKAVEGENGRFYGETLQYLGDFYLENNLPDSARAFFAESLRIYEPKTGVNHPDFYWVLQGRMAKTLGLLRQTSQADSLFRCALDSLERNPKPNEPYLVSLFSDRGKFYEQVEKWDKAEVFHLRACQLFEKIFGRHNHEFARLNLDLARLYLKTDQTAKASACLLAISPESRAFWADAAQYFSTEEMLQVLPQARELADWVLVLNDRAPNAQVHEEAFDNALFFKTFALDHTRRRERAFAAAPDSLRALVEDWKALKRRLAQAYTAPNTNAESIAALEEQTSAREKELTKLFRIFAKDREDFTWKTVHRQLNASEAAVEFVRYEKPGSAARYGAFLLRYSDKSPVFVPLFEENELETLLKKGKGRNSISNLYRADINKTTPKSLYKLIWAPLESYLTSTKTIFCSPVGLLHRVNLAAIPRPEGGIFSDKYVFSQWGSTRELAERPVFSYEDSTAVLMGGINNKTDSLRMLAVKEGRKWENAATTAASTVSRAGAEPLPEDGLPYLAGTATEVSTIFQVLERTGWETRVDTGYAASEEALKRCASSGHSPRVLHIATHGRYFPEQAETSAPDLFFKTAKDPMQRSVLAMAGAERAWQTGKGLTNLDDGILTAYEISQLDLSHTELVVLSACETGLGDIEDYEGVFGLHRAFKIAGVRYVIMSLWKVDDVATRYFMTEFYRAWREKNQSIPEAFRSAQQWMQEKPEYKDAPFFWAGFVLVE